jgi:carboxylate-amine ligase
MREFVENDFPTVGIEQEFHLIDPETAELVPCVDNVFKELDEELEEFFNKLVSAGDVTRPGDLWWILRPQPPLGTVEIRAFDLPTDVRRLGSLAGISQAALSLYQDHYFQGIAPSKLNTAYLDQNHFKAMRYGLNCKVIDSMTGQIVDMRTLLEKLFDAIEPKCKELHSSEHLDFARKMLWEPTESQWQKKTCEKLNGDLRELELKIAEKTTFSFLSQKDTKTVLP